MGRPVAGDYSQAVRALLVTLAAVAATTALAAQATGAERYKRHTIRSEGLSLAVPTPWKAVDANLPLATLREFERQNPKLAPFIRQLMGPSSPAKFLAFDPALRSGFATNVNVVSVAIPNVTFAQYRAALVGEIRSIVGSEPVAARTVKVGGRRALRLDYRLRITAGTTVTVQTLQYAFQRPGKSVVVTYTTLPSLKSRYASTFARSAASIRFS
jgi:hypothetical protein